MLNNKEVDKDFDENITLVGETTSTCKSSINDNISDLLSMVIYFIKLSHLFLKFDFISFVAPT